MDKPEYEFKDFGGTVADWSCKCLCSGVYGHGRDKNKTQAKKQAAFEVLEKLFDNDSQQSRSSQPDHQTVSQPADMNASSRRNDNSAETEKQKMRESEGKAL